jgi:hypothetical protein
MQPVNSVHFILPAIALGLAIISIVRPAWPLLAVAVILIAIDLLVR